MAGDICAFDTEQKPLLNASVTKIKTHFPSLTSSSIKLQMVQVHLNI